MPHPASTIVAAFSRGRPPPPGTPLNLLSSGPDPVYEIGKNLLLKYVGREEEMAAEWTSIVYEQLEQEEPGGFRVPRPIRSSNTGRFVDSGWKAFDFVDGYQTDTRDWDEVLGAATRFHEVIKNFGRPSGLSRRTDPWAVADRVAWEEQSTTIMEDKDRELPTAYLQLQQIRDQEPSPSRDSKWIPQIIHGDCAGNILFPRASHGDEDPLIIDFSPYFRPALYAEAIVLVDAYLWHGQSTRDIDELTDVEEPTMLQMLIRAALFRLVAASERWRQHGKKPDRYQREKFRKLADWLEKKYRLSWEES